MKITHHINFAGHFVNIETDTLTMSVRTETGAPGELQAHALEMRNKAARLLSRAALIEEASGMLQRDSAGKHKAVKHGQCPACGHWGDDCTGARMKTRIPEIAYHYRGGIERGARYTWRDGYSETTNNGRVLYPWCTKKECRAEARSRGARAVFYRDGNKEARA